MLKNLELQITENWLKILVKEWRQRKSDDDKVLIERLLVRYEERYQALTNTTFEWMDDYEKEERRHLHEKHNEKIYSK